MRGLNTFVLPQVMSIKTLRCGVSSSKSLCNPSIMEFLSISEFQVSQSSSDNWTEYETTKTLVNVYIEIVWLWFSYIQEILKCNKTSSQCKSKSFYSSSNLIVIINVIKIKMEYLWVMFNKLNVSYFFSKFWIIFFDVVMISMNMNMSVPSHFSIFYN